MSTETDNPAYDNLEEMLEADPEEEVAETGEEGEEAEEGTDTDTGEEEDKGKDTEDPRIPSKFKGKTAAEIAEAYTNLEGMINTKAMEIAQSLLGGKLPDNQSKKDNEVDDDLGLTEEQLKNMSPKQFLQHINKTITERAQRIAADTLQRSNTIRSDVRREITEVVKNHPHIKTNEGYKNVVLDMIEAASARGEKLTLREACKRADKAMSITPAKPADTATDKAKKKPRTAVETTDGLDGGKDLNDEDQVRAGILGGGQSTGLKGLGV